jgi:glutathione S-transferase
MLDHRVAAPEIKPAVGCYLRLLDEMESQLTQTPYLAETAFSTADTAVVPFLTRIDHLGMGALIAARPRAKAWLETIQARPAFKRAVTDIIPSAVVETFRKYGAEAWPDLSKLAE